MTDHRTAYVEAFTQGARARFPHLSEDACRAIGEHLADQPHAQLSVVHGMGMPTDDDERSDYSDVGSFLWAARRERPELFGEPPLPADQSPVENGEVKSHD